jgi:hypothetical protein
VSDDEELAARALRTQLAHLDTPPTRVDVGQVVREGRRAQRRWHVATALTVTALVGVLGVPSAIALGGGGGPGVTGGPASAVTVPVGPLVPATCTMTNLPVPAGITEVFLDATDRTGRFYAGSGRYGATKQIKAIVWRDGVPAVIDVPGVSGEGRSVPTDANSAGVVVGVWFDSSALGPAFVWMYRAGVVSRLPVPAGYAALGSSRALVNDRGDVAASVYNEQQSSRIAIWPAAAPDRPYLLDTGRAAAPNAIRADGAVAGVTYPAESAISDEQAVVWTMDRRGRVLAVPAGWDVAAPLDLHDDVVYGTVLQKPLVQPPSPGSTAGWWPRSAGSAAVRWNLRTGKVEVFGSLPGSFAAANHTGWLVVHARRGGEREADGVVVSPQRHAYRLPVRNERDGVQVIWISEDGRTVVGSTGDYPTAYHPVTWHCTY